MMGINSKYQGREVSCKLLSSSLRLLQKRGIPLKEMVSGLPYPLEHILNPKERIDWKSHGRLHDNIAKFLSHEEIVEFTASVWRSAAWLKSFQYFIKLILSTENCYFWLVNQNWGGLRRLCGNVLGTSLQKVGPGLLQMDLTIAPGYEQYPIFFIFAKGTISGIPTVLNLPAAQVQMTPIEDGMRYLVHYQENKSFSYYIKKVLLFPVSIWLAASELKKSNEQLQERYQQLQEEIYKKEQLQKKEAELREKLQQLNETLEERILERTRELELSYRDLETEKSSFHTLGEISAMIAHDLSGPLHAIQFCFNELQETGFQSSPEEYIKQMKTASSRAVDLINGLKNYLENPLENSDSCSFLKVHNYVLRLMKVQFYKLDFSRVKIHFDSALEETMLKISRMNLIHVLYNLYKNSFNNLLNHKIAAPQITISLKENTSQKVVFEISDNGTGLSREQFEQITALTMVPPQNLNTKKGLGLRLIRRLLERIEGSISVDFGQEQGTRVEISLKK